MKIFYSIVFFLIIHPLISDYTVKGQPGSGYMYVWVMNEENDTIFFNEKRDWSISISWQDSMVKDLNEITEFDTDPKFVYVRDAGKYGKVIIYRRFQPISKIFVIHQNDSMVVHLKNVPDHTYNLVIKKLPFKKGEYEIDCSKADKENLYHKVCNYCIDITPYYWWEDDDQE